MPSGRPREGWRANLVAIILIRFLHIFQPRVLPSSSGQLLRFENLDTITRLRTGTFKSPPALLLFRQRLLLHTVFELSCGDIRAITTAKSHPLLIKVITPILDSVNSGHLATSRQPTKRLRTIFRPSPRHEETAPLLGILIDLISTLFPYSTTVIFGIDIHDTYGVPSGLSREFSCTTLISSDDHLYPHPYWRHHLLRPGVVHGVHSCLHNIISSSRLRTLQHCILLSHLSISFYMYEQKYFIFPPVWIGDAFKRSISCTCLSSALVRCQVLGFY